MKKKLISVLASAGIGISAMTAAFPVDFGEITAYAAADYPVQEFRLAMADTDNNVTSAGTALAPSAEKGTENEKWSLNYVSSGVYEIVNSATGQILTANGSSVSLANDTDGASQRWKIEGVQKDFDGLQDNKQRRFFKGSDLYGGRRLRAFGIFKRRISEIQDKS